jgi:hypothetical protein
MGGNVFGTAPWYLSRSTLDNATFGDHYIPHDGDRESLWLESGTKGVMDGLGFYPTVVERPRNKLEAISAVSCRCHSDSAVLPNESSCSRQFVADTFQPLSGGCRGQPANQIITTGRVIAPSPLPCARFHLHEATDAAVRGRNQERAQPRRYHLILPPSI